MDGGHHEDAIHHVQHYSDRFVGSGGGGFGSGNGGNRHHQQRSVQMDIESAHGHGSQHAHSRQPSPQSSASHRSPPHPSSPRHHGSSVSPSVSPIVAVNKPIRRRMRMITSCLECRRRKLKCNKKDPCENCEKFARECVFLGSKLDEAGQLRLTEIKEKVGSLERALERDVARSSTSRGGKQGSFVVDDIDYGYAEDLELWPADVMGDATLDYVPQGAEDVLDLGVQIGRMRLTDRVGGLPGPQIADEIAAGVSDRMQDVPIHLSGIPTGVGAAPTMGMPSGRLPGGTLPDFMQPGATFIAPSASFVFGQTVNTGPALDVLLPTRAAADRLMTQYFRAVHPVARCVHQPSFEAEYDVFWEEICTNFEPKPSTQAVMFAAMLSAAISLDGGSVMHEFGVDRATLIENLKLGVETALCKASFLRSTRFETLQGLVMYLIPLCRAEISRAHSVLVGAAVRMAECMGLHRDGEVYGLNPVDTHIRRLIWHQLCFLDIRTAEAHGPRPFIRREDYDTRLPENCDEGQILANGPRPANEARWTTMLLPIIRFEVNEMMRVVWVDRRKLESKKITLTEVLAKTENFRKRMMEKYERLLDDNVPVQRYARLVMHLLLYRLYAMTLHAYHHSSGTQLPARLNNVVVMAGIMIIEISTQLENDRAFRDWAWYFGTYTQYQIALLLATEVYFRPQNREAARIWACLDYVFHLDRNLPTDVKAAQVFTEVMSKTLVYNNMRRTRTGSQGKAAAARGGGGGAGLDLASQSGHAPQPLDTCSYYRQESVTPPVTSPSSTSTTTLGGSAVLAGGYGHSPWQAQQAQAQQQAAVAAAVAATASASNSPETSNTSETGTSVSSHGGAAAHHSMSLPHALSRQAGASASASASSARGMEGVDWDTLNAIFPQDPATGEINLAGYHDPSISMNWRQWR